MVSKFPIPVCIDCNDEIIDARNKNRGICKKCRRKRSNESTKRWTERKRLERLGA